MSAFDEMSREELRKALEMFAKSWLAHDGCWFLAAEERLGMAEAIELDTGSWARFAAVEAKRILTTFDIKKGSGLAALEKALGLRMYSLINAQRTEWSEDGSRCAYLSMFVVCRKRAAAKGSRISPAKASAQLSSTPLHERLTRESKPAAYTARPKLNPISIARGNSASILGLKSGEILSSWQQKRGCRTGVEMLLCVPPSSRGGDADG